MCFKTFGRRIEAELSRISYVPSFITAGICLALAIFVAVTGKSGYYQLFYDFPKGTPPFLLRAFFEGLFYTVFGFSFGGFLFSKQICRADCRWQTALLFICAVFVSYARTVAVYQAGALFFGLLLSILLCVCLAVLFFTVKEAYFLSACGIFLCFFWGIYTVYYTFALFLLNG